MKSLNLAALYSAGIAFAFAAPGAIHLLQKPALSKTEIVSSYSGDLWRVSRGGGVATRLTSGPGFESDASFSPDGKTLAFTGEYDGNVDVFIVPDSGGVPKRLTFHPDADRVVGWTPDGARVLFRSNRFSHPKTTQLYTVPVDGGLPEALPLPVACVGAYSPDGKHMLYAPLDGGQFAPGFTNFVAWRRYRGGTASYLWLVDFADLNTVKIPRTDSNDIYPMWIGGKTYFLSDRNGPMTLFSYDPQSTKVTELVANTGKDIMSASAGPGGIVYDQFGQVHLYDIASGKEHAVNIFDKLQQRIVALPLPARAYLGLEAGRPGMLFVLEPGAGGGGGRGAGGGGATLTRFDLKTRKSEKLADGVGSFDLSANGDKMLLRMGGAGGRGAPGAIPAVPSYVIVPSATPLKPGEGALKVANIEVNVDPIAEWKQMYHEVWRIQRSYFYDPNLHGVNTADAEKEYEKFLDSLSSRADLNYIFKDMLSDITSGHLRGGGGNIPLAKAVPGGLLGADYEIANGRYRFKKIYIGESWNPQLQAPLAQPGLNVNEGDYLLAVNGQDLSGKDDVSRLLENTAGKPVLLKIGADASGANAREITVVPIASEAQLRHAEWIAENRRKVDQLSGGKLAYVYLPDTAQGGLTNFNRYYFAQSDKLGAVIDERFNSGGQMADYIIEAMRRQLMGFWSPRYGAIYRTPAASILGPKVMIINELAGSGGDAMPWMFRYTKLGPLVGKRTWGGLIGVSEYPALMDGGNVTAPNFGFFSPEGQWDVENHGVAPDVEVEMDPKLVSAGHDPQLERAVAMTLQLLEKNPPAVPRRPEFPNYQRPAKPATSAGSGGR